MQKSFYIIFLFFILYKSRGQSTVIENRPKKDTIINGIHYAVENFKFSKSVMPSDYHPQRSDTLKVKITKENKRNKITVYFRCDSTLGVQGYASDIIYSYELKTDSGWVDQFDFKHTLFDIRFYSPDSTKVVSNYKGDVRFYNLRKSATFQLYLAEKGEYRIKIIVVVSNAFMDAGRSSHIWYSDCFKVK